VQASAATQHGRRGGPFGVRRASRRRRASQRSR
jgi:hypothetical protein